jgi:hypothetical protein
VNPLKGGGDLLNGIDKFTDDDYGILSFFQILKPGPFSQVKDIWLCR